MALWLRENVLDWPLRRSIAIYDSLRNDEHLWKRVVKVVVATTLADGIMLIPSVETRIGRAAYLVGITTGFGHPGRRFGQMVETIALLVIGTVIGTAWSVLGVYLGSLLFHSNPPAAYTVRAVFLVIALFVHGFFRAFTPRIFLGTLLFIIANVVNLVFTDKTVTTATVTTVIYPTFLALAVVFCVNVILFPEFSSAYLGGTVASSLQEIAIAVRLSGDYFFQTPGHQCKSDPGRNAPSKISGEGSMLSISTVTASKAKVRAKVNACRATQNECDFELAFSVLPPRNLKAISQTHISKITMNVIAIIGACESKFALLGEDGQITPKSALVANNSSSGENSETISTNQQTTSSDPKLVHFDDGLEVLMPKREIESGDPELLQYYIKQMESSFKELQTCVERSIEVVIACVSYAYRVPHMPNGAKPPAGVAVGEMDLHAETMRQAIHVFDQAIHTALDSHGIWNAVGSEWPDIMPREEIFLISSVYLNMRQVATQVGDMLDHCCLLVDACQKRKSRRRIHAPRIAWRRWLQTGGGEDQKAEDATNPRNLQTPERGGANLEGEETDEEEEDILQGEHMSDLEDTEARGQDPSPRGEIKRAKSLALGSRREGSVALHIRSSITSTLESARYSSEVQYALKITFASMLVLWPAFVDRWNTWFSLERALWAALQLILILEPTVGDSVLTFILRGIGTTFGCLWGWAAYEARNGNRVVCAAMIAIGIIPAAYLTVGSQYVKAGIVTNVSITVVALATEIKAVQGTPTETFLRRFIAFTIGATVALVVQFTFLPAKARTHMVKSLANAVEHMQEMQSSIAFGIETVSIPDIAAPNNLRRFEKASARAKACLQAAEGYMPFCTKEPRLKGPFEGPLLVYREIAFILHQIIDRMENMITLRAAYGSGPLQKHNSQIFPYRRNLASSVLVILFSVQEALMTRFPLPQFMPSARLAQIRLINRVREIVRDNGRNRTETGDADDGGLVTRKHAIRRNFLSWNAGQMAQAEVIEYLEELIDLVKLLVGANEFRTGLLFRPSFLQQVEKYYTQPDELLYPQQSRQKEPSFSQPHNDDMAVADGTGVLPPRKRRTSSFSLRLRKTRSSEPENPNTIAGQDELPYTLRRIQSRKQGQAALKRRLTFEDDAEIAGRGSSNSNSNSNDDDDDDDDDDEDHAIAE